MFSKIATTIRATGLRSYANKRKVALCSPSNTVKVKTGKYTVSNGLFRCYSSLRDLGAIDTNPSEFEDNLEDPFAYMQGEGGNQAEEDYVQMDEEVHAERLEQDMLADEEIVMPEPNPGFSGHEPDEAQHYDASTEDTMQYTGIVSGSLQSTPKEQRMLKTQLYRPGYELVEHHSGGRYRQAVQIWEEHNCFTGQHLHYRAYQAALASIVSVVQVTKDDAKRAAYRKMCYDINSRLSELGFTQGFGIINSIIKLEAQFGHLNKMQQWKEYLLQNHVPSLDTYLSFLRVYSKSGDAAGAKSIWKEFTEVYHILPNLQAYISIIKCLGNAQEACWREYYEKGMKLLKQEPIINRKRWRLLHNAAMGAAICMGNFDEVLQIRDAMKDHGIFLDMMTFPKLLRAAELANNWELATETIDEASTRYDFSLNLYFWERAADVLLSMAVTHEQTETATLCQVQCNEIIVAFRKLGLPPGAKRPPYWTLKELRHKHMRVRMHWKLASRKFVKLDVPVSDLVRQMAGKTASQNTTCDDSTIDKILSDTLKSEEGSSLASLTRVKGNSRQTRAEKDPTAEFSAKQAQNIFG